MTDRRELPPGLYLHFLDRELGDAFEFALRPDVAVRALATLALGTASPLFCSVSALLENPALADAEATVVDLAAAGVLLPYSTHAGLDEFMESRRTLYRHDQDRYPAYFASRLPSGLGQLQPVMFKGGGSTTNMLDLRMAQWAAGDSGAGAAQDLPATQRRRTLTHVGDRLRARDGRAVTFALFADLVQGSTDRPLERAVRRQISLEYTDHHRTAHRGRIPTGVADALHLLEDQLQPEHHAEWDAPVLEQLLRAAGLGRLLDGWPRGLWQPLLALRGHAAHVRFVDHIAWICDALDSATRVGDVPMRRAQQVLAVRRHARPEQDPTGADGSDLLDWAAQNLAATVARMHESDLGPHLNLHEHRVTPETADILLLVATDVEQTATLAAFGHPPGARVRSVAFGTRVFFDLGTVSGQRVWLARTEMGASGAGGSQAVATDAIARLKPAWTVMVGIAFGVDSNTQKIGDVLVPTEVVLYDNQRVGADRTIIRGLRPAADAMLLSRLRAAEIDWTGCQVHFGALLSGDDLVDNEEHREWLIAEAAGGRAIGGEMELVGVFTAAEVYKARWIAVKAICDWAAAKNSRGKDARQRKAARNAAGFARHAVDRGLLASPTD